jgi:Carboxypeptidase regulatory-like domain
MDHMSSSARARTAQVSRAGRLSTALALLGVLVAIDASLALAPAAQASETTGLAPAGSLVSALGSGSGQISGTVTAAASKAALAGIEVCAYSKLSEIGGELGEHCATTDAAGEYIVAHLVAAEYTVEFYSLGGEYATQYYNEKASFLEATKVPLVEGAAVSGIDAEMVAAGEITGTVTTGEAPLEDIKVCAVETGDEFIAQCTSSGPSGEYTISRLPAAEYTVDFYSLSGSYVTQYYDEKSSLAGATKVLVRVGDVTAGIDAAMVAAGKISGTVTDALSNAPLENIKVCAYESGGEALVQCTSTSTSGEYTISRLAAADYTVGFSAVNGEYLTQYYSDTPSLAEAVKVPVTNGVTAADIDAAMQPLKDAVAPVNLAEAPPNIVGEAEVGAILTCAKGSWTGNPEPTFAYQWLREGTPIAGATSRFYAVQTFDQAHALTCEVTASNFKGAVTVASAPLEIPAETPANVELPHIYGTPSVGSILSCEAGLWTGYPKPEFNYRWLRGEETIAGATSSAYTVQAADRGLALSCEVTGTNPAGVASVRSASVKVANEASSNGAGTTGGAPAGSASVGVQSFITAKNAAVSLSGPITSKAGAVLVPLRCWLTTGSCPKATIQVTVIEDIRGGSVTGIAASTGASTAKRKVVVAKLSVALRAGQGETVKVTLNAAGRKLLAGRRRFAARVSVVIEGTSIGAQDVAISRPAKKS